MAVTGDIFKSLTFDGESSRDYGVYITGQAVYNAPERDVEMVTIPGRNGAFALDKGRFENIEVTYPAGVFANTDTEFAKAISDFRNMLCSRQGYCRLTDEYNPDEYRLAVYKSGLEVDPVQLKAGQFDITFECKPQRYLTSGEEKKVLGTWGDTETKTGEIVELENDGSLAVKSAEVSLEPQQDLHGYDKPWSGGNGKNKLNYDLWATNIHSDTPSNAISGTGVFENNGVTLTATANDCYTPFGGNTFDNIRVPVSEGETITLSWETSDNVNGLCYIFGNGATSSMKYEDNLHHKSVVYTVPNGVTFVTFRMGVAISGNTIHYKNIMIRKDGDATWKPYSNICPITGASDVDVNVSGKNLINISDVEIGTAWNGASNTARARLIVNLIKGQIYTLKMNGTSDLDSWYGTLTDTIPPSSAGGSLSNPWTFTATTKYLSLGFNKANITQADVEALKLQLEYGSTATDYVPYNTDSDTYTTSLGTTVYGGTAELVGGTGKSTMASVDLGTLDWAKTATASGSYRFYSTDLASVIKVVSSTSAIGNMICSQYEAVSFDTANANNNGIYIHTNKSIGIYDSSKASMSATDFKTAMNGVQLVYELATPTTLSLTPTTVNLIDGTNYVFSPQGEITLEYGTNPNFIVNPTLFGCGPLIEAKGYGDIQFNGHTVSLQDGTVGQVTLWGYTNKVIGAPLVTPFYSNITKTFQTNMFNSSDSFQFFVEVHLAITDSTAPTVTSSGTSTATANLSGGVVWVNIMAPITSLTVGSSDIVTASATLTWSSSKKLKIDMEVVYTDGFVDYRVTITRTGTITYSADSSQYIVLNQCTATSTLNLLGNPTYIDCDLGEAYKINDGKPVGLNSFVDLGSKLPELAPGINEFTVSNTFTEVAVVPRWWRI